MKYGEARTFPIIKDTCELKAKGELTEFKVTKKLGKDGTCCMFEAEFGVQSESAGCGYCNKNELGFVESWYKDCGIATHICALCMIDQDVGKVTLDLDKDLRSDIATKNDIQENCGRYFKYQVALGGEDEGSEWAYLTAAKAAKFNILYLPERVGAKRLEIEKAVEEYNADKLTEKIWIFCQCKKEK